MPEPTLAWPGCSSPHCVSSDEIERLLHLAPVIYRGHNEDVVRPVARTVAGLVVVPFLALASAVAPAHSHEADGAHRHAVVHSHFDAHDAGTVQGHDRTEVEHDPERVVWLDSALVHALPYQLHPPPALVTDGAEPVGISSSWAVIACDAAAPVHGPPRRASSLRGPPLLLA